MTTTGWIGDAADGEGPVPLPVTNVLLGMKERKPGDVVAYALARSRAEEARQAREEAAAAPDPDEHAANLVGRGYMPGLASQLAQRLGDTVAELEAEREKIEKGRRRQERIARDHAAGRITAFDIARMQDCDEGDEGRAALLEKRAKGLRTQIADAQAMISPQPQRDMDPLEAASRQAHEVFREMTRQRMAEAAQGRPQASPPFASRGSAGGGDGTEHTGPDCAICAEGRRRDAALRAAEAAGEYKAPPASEYFGPAITRDTGYDDDGKIGNYAPMIYR
jgi:hypothetical protein